MVSININSFTTKNILYLSEILELFNNQGTFLLICCNSFDNEDFIDEETFNIIKNISGLPTSLDLRPITYTKCIVCRQIISYHFDNTEEKPEECDKCVLLSEKMKKNIRNLSSQEIKEKKKFLEDCIVDLLKRYTNNKSLIQEKIKLIKNNSKFNKIIRLNQLNLNKNLIFIKDIEADLQNLIKNNFIEIDFKRIKRKIAKCHDLISKNIIKLDKIS